MVQGSLATRLRVLRAERGLTLRQVADMTGVAKETLSGIERGVRHPQDLTLAKIAMGYGVPVEKLLEEPVPLVEAPTGSGQPELSEEGQSRTMATFSYDPARGTPTMSLAEVRHHRRGIEGRNEELRREIEEYREGPLLPQGWLDEIDTDVETLRRLLDPVINYEGLTSSSYEGLADVKDDWEDERLQLEDAFNALTSLRKRAHNLVSQKGAAANQARIKVGSEAAEFLQDGEKAERER